MHWLADVHFWVEISAISEDSDSIIVSEDVQFTYKRPETLNLKRSGSVAILSR